MLKLYTDTQFLTETHRKEVFPLLFDLHFKPDERLAHYYEVVESIAACDIIVMPIDYTRFIKHKKAFDALLKASKTNHKPLWIYTAGDFGFTNYIKNSYTFRLGGFDSTLSDTNFIMPAFINDPYVAQMPNSFSVLKKTKKPSIGFVGHAQSGFLKYLKEGVGHLKVGVIRALHRVLVDAQVFYPSSVKRAGYLSALLKDNRIDSHFILRNKYRAGVTSEAEKQKSMIEFYENIFNNAYTFCSRGVGNFSVRFYETLAMGRIPILLNTDCRLPLHTTIDWKTHCVIIEEAEVHKMPAHILAFHEALSSADFENIQHNNREIWKTKLMRHAYFIAIHDVFIAKLEVHE
ncbi:exostosin family protein [Lacinutrix sp. Hel_I_90]|uniref:exostosin domain-containing protein n=1 Tax=Lacinutrix sp. Hel_I_90 TaxID=1249999 RepID=UPI0005CA8C82|nr:exostosin family protein [Lacinutrix sp. Hel_I_90]